jgi:serine phosphatase RsbU (regulator of sigma subunit)
MLPQGFSDERVEIVVRYDEVDVVGGDYFSLFKTDDDKLFLCLYHVTGRGVAGALMATRIDSFVRHEISIVGHPCEIVERLQRFARQRFGELNLQAARIAQSASRLFSRDSVGMSFTKNERRARRSLASIQR